MSAMLKALFWGSAAGIAWTHAGYPLAAGVAARLRPRPVRKGDELPRVTVVIAAHDEEDVIERRLENLLALDYPPDLLDVIVASDASTDRTDELVEAVAAREPRVRLLRCPRGGKVAAQDAAVRETDAEVVAFSDANATWAPDALRLLVRSFADPEVAYVCGRLTPPGPGRRQPRGRRTGASSSGCASRSRGSGRSRAATARSTPCGARTTSRSTRASATTSRSRT